MQHALRAGNLQVDHFDPRRKGDYVQEYDNFFPASSYCNRKKSNTWPTRQEVASGCRFLNPCEEMDYGDQIFEDPQTYELRGTTTAACWHIRMCGLNAEHLIHERRRRAHHWAKLNQTAISNLKRDYQEVADLIKSYREEVEVMIPQIPALPDEPKQ
jgi:hypothetical protein